MASKAFDLSDRSAASLATLLSLQPEARSAWGEADLAAMLRHQLTAPLLQELGARGTGLRTDALSPPADSREEPDEAPIQTLAQLFADPSPPLDLLERVKEFAKAARTDPAGELPAELATVIYYAAIIAARLRRAASISQLDDEALRSGAAYALQQTWLDESLRHLFQEFGSLSTDSRSEAAP